MKSEEVIELIEKYWRFDEGQQSISSWHDKQDLIKELNSMNSKLMVFSPEQSGKILDAVDNINNNNE